MQRYVYFLVVCLLILPGCMKKKVPMPSHVQPGYLDIDPGTKLEPIGLSKTIVSIKRGSLIGAYHSGYSEGSKNICNNNNVADIFWSSSRATIGGIDDDFSQYFYETLTSRGYNVVGDPKRIFERDEELSRSKYLIAAEIRGMKANVCRIYDFWTGSSKGTENGEVWMEVEWTVYSPLEKKTLLQVTTTGYQKSVEERNDGFRTIMFEAFASAAEGLGADKDFYNLVSGRQVKQHLTDLQVGDSELRIKAVENHITPFSSNPDRVTDSAVTVRTAYGHGSGFIVSKEGYILTNHHVVGEADEVAITFSNGFELLGKVIRSNETRDIALVKVDVNSARPMPIRTSPVKILEPVFPVGTPLYTDMQSTITRGIVSAVREDKDTGLTLIQADADVQPGNSGGALVDIKGNVVGVCVSGIGERSIGINYFIPINEALYALKIQLVK